MRYLATIGALSACISASSNIPVNPSVWAIAQFAGAVNAFSIDGSKMPKSSFSLFEFSPSGKVTVPLMIVNGGCSKTDYPADLAEKIAIIARRIWDFGIKWALAGSLGASGAILYSISDDGPVQGTLLPPPRPQGPYVPTLNIIKDVSEPILILGAHTNSIIAGPGINDDGSGINALLEVARALSGYTVNSAVTSAFWTAEELYQHPGSSHFLQTLSAAEKSKIRAYLNFDMIASPNYVNAIYDGDGKAFGTAGPSGSAELQALSQKILSSCCWRDLYWCKNNKTAEEVVMFGGEAGSPYDSCYHTACDTVNNLNMDALVLRTMGVAEAVAITVKKNVARARRSSEGHEHVGGCAHSYSWI
ncbi:hypothetical protein COCCADRAFT_40512 [Bipolaris zeicola 26-R-13]|uniref:Peptide hydrolase n=1 Tax=Cochliobolus carbonum (strain 26-R-13) TaxID=930089 RepID=W6Y1X8_COCC2|nr:uncharacterized protein COCCADRAFT_40512 [Bipolaris zeicola 26-R-13]EUC29069.1 hypothetical protein COCCADRAFT_40512 [Bipolaris zeicola 26-R-13]